MYAKCGSLDDARSVFQGLESKNVVTWTSMVAAYAQFGDFKEAYGLYQTIQAKPNQVTFLTILTACAEAGALNEAMEIERQILEGGHFEKNESALGNSLINTFNKCGSLGDAERVFKSMAGKNVVTWTSMVAGYAQCGHPQEAMVVFCRMHLEGVEPNDITFSTVVAVCSELGSPRVASLLHRQIASKGLDGDMVICNGMINMYSKCGMLDAAKGVFQQMRTKNFVSWTAMIGAHVVEKETGAALELLRQMDVEGFNPNEVTMVSILDGCSNSDSEACIETAKCIHRTCIIGTEMEQGTAIGTAIINLYARSRSNSSNSSSLEMDQAREAFERIICKDTMAWTVMMSCYMQAGYGREALKLYQRMQQEGSPPNEFTFLNLLLSCTKLGAKQESRLIFSHLVESGLLVSGNLELLGSCIICFHGVCGTLGEARSAFQRLVNKDVGAFNAMIGVLGQHGLYEESMLLFQQMIQDGVEPDAVTFTYMLFSCSHTGGGIETACQWFGMMRDDHNVAANQEHLNCVIDLLVRSGCVGDAEALVRKFSCDDESAAAWITLLSGCCAHGNLDGAKRAAERIAALDPRSPAPYVLLYNFYAGKHV